MGEEDGERLPLDVYTDIVETLKSPEDRESLKALALTARHLRPLSQRLLFRQVTIILRGISWDRPAKGRMLKFMELASDSTIPLASFVVDLQFTFKDYKRPDAKETEMAPRFISNLINIKILRMSSAPAYGGLNSKSARLDWRSLDQHMMSSLVNVVASQPSLESLQIQGFDSVPTPILSSLKGSQSLKELSIGYIQFDEEISQNEVLVDRNNKLVYSKIFGHCTMGFHRPIPYTRDDITQNPVLDLTQLKNLSTDCLTRSDFEQFKAIIRSAHNIDSLHCQMYGSHLSWDGLTDSISSGSSLTLRVLKVTISPYRLDSNGDGNSFEGDPFNGFIDVLQALSKSLDHLEVIRIDLCNLRLRHMDGDFMYDELQDQCTILDNLFPGAFPRLRDLQITGDVTVFDCEEVDGIEPEVKEKVEEIKERSFPNILAIATINFEWYFAVECEEVDHDFDDLW